MFTFEGTWKYSKIYNGNKLQFLRLYISLILKEFSSSIIIKKNDLNITWDDLLNNDFLLDKDEDYNLSIDVKKFFIDCSQLKSLNFLLGENYIESNPCLLYTSPSPRDGLLSRMPSSA